jgi:hypothetical protein
LFCFSKEGYDSVSIRGGTSPLVYRNVDKCFSQKSKKQQPIRNTVFNNEYLLFEIFVDFDGYDTVVDFDGCKFTMLFLSRKKKI